MDERSSSGELVKQSICCAFLSSRRRPGSRPPQTQTLRSSARPCARLKIPEWPRPGSRPPPGRRKVIFAHHQRGFEIRAHGSGLRPARGQAFVPGIHRGAARTAVFTAFRRFSAPCETLISRMNQELASGLVFACAARCRLTVSETVAPPAICRNWSYRLNGYDRH